MPKYMIVIKDEDLGTYAAFRDTFPEADALRMDAECGTGAYTELYERVTTEDGVDEYQFLLS